ncbi:hypothetical protein K6U06_00910 [Acidiferrimicrobium sp. IK]|uniref:DUF4286 family protein n=1 Tax=Acidiferrimicrobium sp. IK TaxID=2871700 RepID=UPI0021CB4563|nr:DUF4286 family protein [Acidiferrimicrobium sp. IK]MCU4182907.1 hypothetical protein [Acidiferrimicrobium sp. IK]
MPKGILVVESSPEGADRDREYNEWYDGTHIGEICAIPGVTGARRYRLHGTEGDVPTYLAVYDLEADDLGAPLVEMAQRSADGRLSPPKALRLDPPPVVKIFELLD